MVNQLITGELQTNCWMCSLPGGNCIVIDPGGDGELILKRLEKLRLNPRFFVLTHAHLDHIAALPFLAAKFPGAGIAVHPSEAGKIGPHSLESHHRDFNTAGYSSYVETLWKPMPEASILLNEGDKLEPFRVMHLPGHSPGSIALYHEEEKQLFSGDTLFRAGVGRTDLPGGDEQLLLQSLQRLFAMNGDINVFPGHGPTTTIRRESGILKITI